MHGVFNPHRDRSNDRSPQIIEPVAVHQRWTCAKPRPPRERPATAGSPPATRRNGHDLGCDNVVPSGLPQDLSQPRRGAVPDATVRGGPLAAAVATRTIHNHFFVFADIGDRPLLYGRRYYHLQHVVTA